MDNLWNLNLRAYVLLGCVCCAVAQLPFRRQLHARVVGGTSTTIERSGGFIVALHYNGVFICGGSLLHERIILSAAHCFADRTDANRWTAEGGISHLNETAHRIRIESLIKPLEFREEDYHMDLAVIKLRRPMIGSKIKLAKLCSHKWKRSDLMTVTGWGLIDPRATAPHQQLQSVDLPIVSMRKCQRLYAGVVNLTESMFCAGGLASKDACTFDSGGPLVHKSEVCGIVSFGVGCASKKYPGVYTNVYYMKLFIEYAMKALLEPE